MRQGTKYKENQYWYYDYGSLGYTIRRIDVISTGRIHCTVTDFNGYNLGDKPAHERRDISTIKFSTLTGWVNKKSAIELSIAEARKIMTDFKTENGIY